MRLNLPDLEALCSCKNLLIAGMGGGFDVFCGLPVYFELRSRGVNCHLASLSFSSHVHRIRGSIPLTGTLVGATAAHTGVVIYFPELYLSRWFREARGEAVTLWCFTKSGVQPMLEGYRALVDHLGIDGILLVDGGVDSLVRGDEADLGTHIDDGITLAAVSQLTDVPLRRLACLGFGAERDMTHAHVLENMAALAAEGAFRGSCSLVREMESYRLYEEAVTWVHGQRFQDPSVINSSVISAVQGHYGDYHTTERTKGSRLWISPLMPLYWFYDLQAVADRNLFVSQILTTTTFQEVMITMGVLRRSFKIRGAERIPLT